MQALFEIEAHPGEPEEIYSYRMVQSGSKIQEKEFAHELFFETLKFLDNIKKIISTYAPEWPVEKIDPVERVILYIGIYELVYMDDAPTAVIINEAIELAKQFADENSNKFVNGVLNAVAQNEKKVKK